MGRKIAVPTQSRLSIDATPKNRNIPVGTKKIRVCTAISRRSRRGDPRPLSWPPEPSPW
jgi:hypothetical protein